MTFGFALILAGFVLLDAGWKGTTPMAVLQGMTAGQKGPGGVLAEAGRGVAVSLSGNESGSNGSPSEMDGLPKKLKGKPQRVEQQLKSSHPEIKAGVRTVVAVILSQFPGLVITSTTTGEHAEHSLHYEGRAVDLAGSPQEMLAAAAWIKKYLTQVLTEGIHNPNLSVKDHHHVSPSFWGSTTWSEHTNHIHVGV